MAIGAAAFIAVALLFLLWPGDTPWINDEPLLIHKALHVQSDGAEGLRGTVGVAYGPVPIWIYASLLALTHDPIRLVTLRSALFLATTVGALLWLAALSKCLYPVAGVVGLVSPYLWIYARQLWDNTFLIPLGALALAAYIAFSVKPERWRLWTAVVPLTMSLLVHPLAMPLALAIVAHALVFHRDWLRRHLGTVVAQAAFFLLLVAPWLFAVGRDAVRHVHVDVAQAAVSTPSSDPTPAPWAPLLFPWLGGRLLSAQGVDYFLGDRWTGGLAMTALAMITWGGHLLVWIGVVTAAALARAGWLRHRPRDSDFHLAVVACAALAANAVLLFAFGRHTHPHYYNGIWICLVYFAWLALSRPPGGAALGAVIRVGGTASIVAGLIVLGFIAVSLHRSGGTRGVHFGPSLATQVDAVRKLGRLSPEAPLTIEVDNMRMFPHALPALRELMAAPGDIAGSRDPVRLRYRDMSDTGWLVVEDSTIR